MTNSEAKKVYDDYMKSLYSAENIAKAGGVENHAKIIRDFKKKERKIKFKDNISTFCHCYLPFIAAFAILLIIAKMLFFPGLTYILILKITTIAGFIWVVIMNIDEIIYKVFFKQDDIAFSRIDTLVIIIIAYFLIKWADSYSILPIWCVLGAATVIGIIFYRLLPYGNTGRLIQAFACIFETYFITTLLPWTNLLKETPLENINEHIYIGLIAVILYLLIFELHDKGTSQTIKKIFKKKKKAASKSSSYTSSTYKRYDNTIYHNLLDAIDFYKSLKDEKMRIFSVDDFFVAGGNSGVLVRVTRHPHLKEKGELVYKYEVTVTDKRGNILEKLTNDEGNRQFTEDLQGLESKYGLQNYRRFEYASEAWNYARNFSTSDTNYQQSQSREQSHTSSQSHSETHEQSSSQRSSETHSSQETSSQAPNDEALFNGCTDKESLTKRYHQLMKTFHPDNPNGDYEMTQRIQNTYETLRKKYE